VTKLNMAEKLTTTIDLGDMSLDVQFINDQIVSVGPVKSTLATDDFPAGGIVMPMQDAAALERIAEAVRVVRKGKGDYRSVCPIHGYQTQCYECPVCLEEEEKKTAAKMAEIAGAEKAL
jgi:hypothetical protein